MPDPTTAGSPEADDPAARHHRETADSPELRGLRRRIDAIDHQLVTLMNERADLAVAAGRAKAAAGRRGIRDAPREAEVLENVLEANIGPLAAADLRAIWRRLMRATRELEARDRGRERTDV